MRSSWPRLIVVSVVAAFLAVLGSPGVTLAAAPTTRTCTLEFAGPRFPAGSPAMIREVDIDWDRCVARAEPFRPLTAADRAKFRDASTSRDAVRVHSARTPAPGDPQVWARHSTWDNFGLETTYIHHMQDFTFDYTNSCWSQLTGIPFWRATTGWVKTAGAFVDVDAHPCAFSVTSSANASFDNTSFPCFGCQPCNHTLWARITSYANGEWIPSYIVTGNLCSGWIHTAQTSGYGIGP